jgi:hypothetical protein
VISKNVVGGQCSACVHAATCTYVQSRPRRVFQCDEFTPLVPIELESDRGVLVETEGQADEGSLARTNGRLGLCSTCEFWETCAFARAESGVWHCDEYH